ncbi:MAG: aspartate/tyrosine/aromatic aminotransferase [Planctomycetales bacterium]|nr:aspartate/tyrosine/aromatic aminotransferase [Planctomycetales bacterium]
MFETLSPAPPDPILGLGESFLADNRPGKINLSIGVFKDEQGQTPVLNCVKLAEQQLLESERTKGYLGIDGLADFNRLATELMLGGIVPPQQVAVCQTPGGTGALRVAADFLAKSLAPSRVWCSAPTWPNHGPIFESAGHEVKSYRYLSADRRTLDLEGMFDDLQQACPGDVVCLHACCHNPSGIDPTAQQWAAIAEQTASRKLMPLIDFAYQGFGDGLVEDQVGIRAMAQKHAEFLLCGSFSKNFGLYSERVGTLMVAVPQVDSANSVASRIKLAVRSNYSNPPRHGAAVVATVLSDPELRRQWEDELTGMRQRIHRMRSEFVAETKRIGCATDFSFLMDQRGMFSFSGLTPLQVDWLRTEKAIYIVGSGRINVAGITPQNLETLAAAVSEALSV